MVGALHHRLLLCFMPSSTTVTRAVEGRIGFSDVVDGSTVVSDTIAARHRNEAAGKSTWMSTTSPP